MHKFFDLHCDTVHKIPEDGGMLSLPSAHVDIERLEAGGYGLMTFAAFVNAGRTDDPYGDCLRLIERMNTAVNESGGRLAHVTTKRSLAENEKNGAISALLSAEEGGVIEDDLSRIDELFRLGVRMMTFTWNYDNDIAGSANGEEKYGLSDFGREFLGRLEGAGIIADVSHLSDKGFYDVAEAATRPFVASHSNARAVFSHPRNLTDDMIRIIGGRGGIIGLNFCADFIGGDGGLDMLCRHARELADCGGIECVAIGGDFDGIPTNPAIPDCSALPTLSCALSDFGFTSREVDLITGGNAERFLAENLPE